MAASDRPETQIGGPPAWLGFGRCGTSANCQNRPWWLTGSSGPHSLRKISIASSVRAPRSRTGTPHASNSFGNSPPTPIPQMNRPSESRSSVVIDLASATGGRSGSSRMLDPIAIRLVRAA